MRIASREWRRDRWFDGVLFALLAHSVAIVVLVIVAERPGVRVDHLLQATPRERVEHLRFLAPRVEATVPPTLAHSNPPTRRSPTPLPQPEPPAAIPASPKAAPAPPAVVAPSGLLASALPIDHRFLVGPAPATGVADLRVRDANTSIAAAVHVVADSIRRHDRGWTVGDSTHRFGIAPCGIYVGSFCIPFRLSSLPNPRPAFAGVDRSFERDAEFDTEVARVRAMNAKPDAAPPP